MNVAFNFSSVHYHVFHAADESRKQYSAEAGVLSNIFAKSLCFISRVSVYIPYLYFLWKKKVK